MLNACIAQNIRFYRKIKNLSQFQLAELAGILEKTVTRAESGKIEIKLSVLEKISNALDIPLFKLFIPENNKNNLINTNLENIKMQLETLNNTKLTALGKIISAIDELK